MNITKTKKDDYLISLNKQPEGSNKIFDSIKTKIESKDFPNRPEVQKKYRRLEKSRESFSWKINHLKVSDIKISDLVNESFNDIIDEVSLRLEEIELALKGKQLWDAGEDFTGPNGR